MEESPTKTEKEGIKEKLERLSTLIQKNKIGEVTKMLNEDHNFLQQLQDKKLYISYQHEHSPLHEASQYLLPDMIKLLIGTFGLPLDCKSKEKIGKDEVLVGPLHRAITGNTVSHIASVKALLSKDGDPENGWVTESFDEETKADLLKTANERKCTKVAKVLKKAFVKEADLEETVKKLNNELDVKTTQVGNLTITVAELEQELKAKSKLLQEISAKVNQKQDSKEKAMLELEDMRKAKNKLEDTVTKLKKELNLKEGKVTKLKENFDLLEQELKAKSKLLQEISAKVKQEQESKERAYRELEETRKTEAEMGETVTKLERQLNLIKIQQEENITELKGNVAKCEQELETKSRLLQEISAKVKQEQESKEKAKLELEEMRKTNAKLEETVTKLEEQLNVKIQQEGIIAQLEQELKTKSKLLKETVDKYEQKLKVKEAKLESEVVNREEKLEKLQNEAQINYDKLDNELSESKALADKATRNFEEVSCQLEEVRSELVEVRSKLKEVNRELEEVKYKFKEANSELEGVKSRYEEANCKLGEITTELENSKSELEVANRKLEDVNNELKEVKSELEEIKRKSDWDVMKDEYPFRKPFVAVIDLEGNNFFKPDITILGEHFPVKKTTLTPKNLAQLEKNYREKILIKLNDRGNGYDGLLLFIFGKNCLRKVSHRN